MSDPKPPRNSVIAKLELKNERLKQWGIILVAFAGLVSSIFAHFKTEEETTAKNSYKELSSAVQKLSKEQRDLHSNIAALHGYLAAKENNNPPIFMSSEPDAEPMPEPEPIRRVRSSSRNEGLSFEIGISDSEGFGSGMGSVAEMPAQAELPALAPPPEQYKAPPLEKITR